MLSSLGVIQNFSKMIYKKNACESENQKFKKIVESAAPRNRDGKGLKNVYRVN